jgi:hypothetical protein
MANGHETDWKRLAEQAAAETNPDKLLDLVKELNEVLDSQEVKPAGAASRPGDPRPRPRPS